MKVKKKVQGKSVVLDYREVKTYPNGYTLYDVYMGDKLLYRTCLTMLQVCEIIEAGYVITEEVFN